MTETINIKQFEFNKKSLLKLESLNELHEKNWFDNWPVIYIINNGEEAYIGETYKVKERIKQHLQNKERLKLTQISVIIDEQSNKSYTLDVEASLIRYMFADQTFILQNGNKGLVNYNYYNRDSYKVKFENEIWPKLKKIGLVKKDLREIENEGVFKYSPYVQLNPHQYELIKEILQKLFEYNNKNKSIMLVKGSAGTGKTVICSYLMKLLNSNNKEEEEVFEDPLTDFYLTKVQENFKNIGFVVPQQSLRETFKKIFNHIPSLNSKMVLSPNDVAKSKINYDLLIVDEAHRLRRRKNLTNYKNFDDNNKLLENSKNSTELDWIIKKSKNQILFYDKDQSIKPTDIPDDYFQQKFKDKLILDYTLYSQFRVLAGKDYIDYIKNILNCKLQNKQNFDNYDFKLFENISELRNQIIIKNNEFGLSRLVAGFGWKWISKKEKDTPDIKIQNLELFWNRTAIDWVNSKNSINEVGCIHTIQGYDLNYVGVIIGPEVTYSEEKNKIVILKDNYKDRNGKAGIDSEEELEKYIKNIYSVLLTRGIKGTYVYAVDDKLREYLKKFITLTN